MRDVTFESLEDQLSESRQQCQATEEEAAEIALRAEARINDLEAQILELQKGGGKGAGRYCRACETKRRIFAYFGGMILATMYFDASGFDRENPRNNFTGYALGLVPLAIVILRWRWLLFARDSHYRSFRDNDLYRRVNEWWREE